MNVPTLPPPAMTTRISDLRARAAPRCSSNASMRVAGDGDVDDVALLDRRGRRGAICDTPSRDERDDPGLAFDVELGDAVSGPRRRDQALDEAHLGARVDPLDRGAGRAGCGAGRARSSTARWRRSGCRGARRSRRGAGRRCGRRPGRCRTSPCATRAIRMLELSPLVTAATASASSMPASSRRSRSKPTPTIVLAARTPGQAAERRLLAVDDGDGVAGGLDGLRPGRNRPGRTRRRRRARRPTSRAQRGRARAASYRRPAQR